MITKSNYYNKIKEISITDLPDTLKAGHEFVEEATGKGQDWSTYEGDKEIKEVIDLYFQKLDAFVKATKLTEQKPTKSKDTTIRKSEKKAVKPKTFTARKNPAAKPKPSPVRSKSRPRIKRKPATKFTGKFVEAFNDEILLIRRMLNMDDKEKTKHQILLFINAIQRKIIEKKIRKTSPYANQIKFIQDWLVELYNKMGETVKVEISEKKLKEFQTITGSRQIRPSIRLIKRYVNLHGKPVEYARVKSLHNAIANAVNKGRIKKSDPYYDKLNEIIDSLRDFNCEVGAKSHLKIHQATLNGLYGVLDGIDKGNGLGELEPVTKNTIMNSQAIQNMEFERLGFHGKWLDFIGDPSPGFTAMIFGRPKMGKSFLAVDFAGYLAEWHGEALYVAKEEGINATLREKIEEMAVAHPDLDFADFLPADLSGYKFVFLDSVTKLRLTPEDLDELRATYRKVSFVFIFQTTKTGAFRGRNDFQHDVDVVIEMPEKGIAVQNGRFNQGGEMEIF